MDQMVHHASVDAMLQALQPSDPVLCLRPKILQSQAALFLMHFPGRVLYSMKCNPHPLVLNALHHAGIRDFETASIPEMVKIEHLFADAGCFFHHPVKSRAAIRQAYETHRVRHFVVDHDSELEKILDILPRRDFTVLVRLATPQTQASIDLSAKFGATPDAAVALLRRISMLGLPAGLTFHVGSQCRSPDAYINALRLAGDVINAAGTPIAVLNVGGGFPVDYPGLAGPELSVYFDAIKDGIERLALPPDCEVMCEPGRALVADAGSLVVQVQMRKEDSLYINDGVYGALMDLRLTKGLNPPVRLCLGDARASTSTFREFTIFGPTCDSLDVLPLPWRLPDTIGEGDWIEIGQLGAYSTVFATDFNGLWRESVVEVLGPPIQTIAA